MRARAWPTNFGLAADDVCYSVMPLFHSNAAVAGFTNIVASGATAVLRRRFSASGLLPDVRKYGVTFFNYVGKPLTYILATPEQPDDADNPLKIAFGNEAAPLDIDRFAQRFGCIVVDGYGSTEGGVNMGKHAGHAAGLARRAGRSRRRARSSTPRRARSARRAKFDAHGRFLNAEDAIGEIVNPDGAGGFEGYYNNDEANAERMRGGMYWTGDLGYRDDARLLLLRRAATPTGCASTARTSPPRRSRTSSPAIPTSCSPRCTRCRRSTSATT